MGKSVKIGDMKANVDKKGPSWVNSFARSRLSDIIPSPDIKENINKIRDLMNMGAIRIPEARDMLRELTGIPPEPREPSATERRRPDSPDVDMLLLEFDCEPFWEEQYGVFGGKNLYFRVYDDKGREIGVISYRVLKTVGFEQIRDELQERINALDRGES